MKEKQIKIEAADIERLAGIYPEMNEAQLEEIALGEKMGLGFSEYASAAIPAEEMKAIREGLDDKRHRAVTAFECRYFYGTMKYLDLFMSTREALFESLILEKNGISYKEIERWASSDGQLQG